MPVPAQWQALASEIEDAVTSRAAAARARQDAYFAVHGRYWQGIRWVVPVEGADGDVDFTRHPTDQAATWTDFGWTLPASLKFALSIDVYNGPQGHGWSATAYVVLGSRVYGRTWHGDGAENRAAGWRDMTGPG